MLALEEILSADRGDQNGRKLCSLGGEATSERNPPKKIWNGVKNSPHPSSHFPTRSNSS